MVLNKKGQGLSLNVIIVAALALIVLVVLIMVFTGRISVFDKGISEEGQAELNLLRVSYGDCHPTSGAESTFTSAVQSADSSEMEEQAKEIIKSEMSRCKAFTDQGSCGSSGCSWK